MALHLHAACLARLACASRSDSARFSDAFVRWCAGRRRSGLAGGLVRGDLALADTAEGAPEGVRWTLERLHLAEQPPRFPRLYFQFASSDMVPGMEGRVTQVVEILQRFPGLRIRIEGYGQISAPPALGRAVSQARAVAVRQVLLRRLQQDPGPRAAAGGANPWLAEDDALGVWGDGGYDESRGRANTEFYEPRLVGDRMQAVGLWGSDPDVRNANFRRESILLDTEEEAKFRRVDFTVVGLYAA